MAFLLQSVYVVNYIDRFDNTEPAVHPWEVPTEYYHFYVL